jgi:hypothetical protein
MNSQNETSEWCLCCKKKIKGGMSFVCKCKNKYCLRCRDATVHKCEFDYKSEQQQKLKSNLPIVTPPKLEKI